MNTKLPTITVLAASLLFSSAAFAESKVPSSDESFMKKAAEGGLVEVKLGEIASTKGKREDVKEFGTRMVKDHSNANADLKTLAEQKGVKLPENLDTKNSALVAKMSKMEGDAFDGAYVRDIVQDHEMDVKEFEKAANEAKDPDVKAFAAKTLPVLKEHLEHIKKLAGK